jgi:hypothetical protein
MTRKSHKNVVIFLTYKGKYDMMKMPPLPHPTSTQLGLYSEQVCSAELRVNHPSAMCFLPVSPTAPSTVLSIAEKTIKLQIEK